MKIRRTRRGVTLYASNEEARTLASLVCVAVANEQAKLDQLLILEASPSGLSPQEAGMKSWRETFTADLRRMAEAMTETTTG